MQRFFAPEEAIDTADCRITLSGGDVIHMRSVLRRKPGDEIWVSDGKQKEYHCRILEYTESQQAILQILYVQEPEYELPVRISLFQALPKGDKMEFIIQKAVELGVRQIIPVRTRRCVMRLDEARAKKKILRWHQISESAAKQSRRLLVPEVLPVQGLEEALALSAGLDLVLMPYELCQDMDMTRRLILECSPGTAIGIFIGPEGGFEPEEVNLAKTFGAVPISLGKRILRTETAGLALLSALMLHLDGRPYPEGTK